MRTEITLLFCIILPHNFRFSHTIPLLLSGSTQNIKHFLQHTLWSTSFSSVWARPVTPGAHATGISSLVELQTSKICLGEKKKSPKLSLWYTPNHLTLPNPHIFPLFLLPPSPPTTHNSPVSRHRARQHTNGSGTNTKTKIVCDTTILRSLKTTERDHAYKCYQQSSHKTRSTPALDDPIINDRGKSSSSGEHRRKLPPLAFSWAEHRCERKSISNYLLNNWQSFREEH